MKHILFMKLRQKRHLLTILLIKPLWLTSLLIICGGFLSVFYFLKNGFHVPKKPLFVPVKYQPLKNLTPPQRHPKNLFLMNDFLIPIFSSYQAEAKLLAKINIHLEITDHSQSVELEDKKMYLRQIIIATLSHLTYEQISQRDKKLMLQANIKHILNDFLSKVKIRRVYLKEIELL